MDKNIEPHPFKPFYPQGAKLLLLGSFPPPEHNQKGEPNWGIRFFYGSKHNLMWKIMGRIFFKDERYFITGEAFDKKKIERFLADKKIAVADTAQKIQRKKPYSPSDSNLIVAEWIDIAQTLMKLPECAAVVTSGDLAFKTLMKAMRLKERLDWGESFQSGGVTVFKLPSSSKRPGPRGVTFERKTALFKSVFDAVGIK